MTKSLLASLAITLSLLGGCQTAAAQQDRTQRVAAPTEADLIGRWRGVYGDSRGTLATELEIRRNSSGNLIAIQSVPDWMGYADFDPVAVSVNADGNVEIADALYSGLVLQFDPVHRQMVGQNGRDQAVHFVRTLPRPESGITTQEVVIPAGAVDLAGTLTLPDGAGPHPAMVVISGRGCWGRGRSLGRVLPRYGMAVLEYDKRGTGESSGSCETATFDDLVDDAVAAMDWLRARPDIEGTQVGLQGGSAGAWTAQGVAERALDDDRLDLPAFIITFIGPSTSIERQQREAGEALADVLGLSESERADVSRAVDLTLDRSLSGQQVYDELTAIKARAEAAGWASQMFDGSDIPASPDAVSDLWLRRFRYDPTPTLRRLSDTPYLSLLGADDAIVPLPSNSDALREAARVSGNPDVRIVIIPGTGHGIEHGDRDPVLPDGTTYRKFDTVEPLYFTETIRFLRERGLMPR